MTSDNSAFINARPRVKINSTQRDDLGVALLQLRIDQPFSGTGHAELRLMNWASSASDGTPDFAFQQIAHGDQVEIFAGGDSDAPALFSGSVTAIEEIYGNGAPRLVLLIEDDLHLLAKKRTSQVFESQSPNDVIQAVLSDVSLNGDVQVSSDSGTWHQLNESHLAFLLRLLSPYQIAMRVEDGNVRIKLEEEDSSPVELHTQNQIQSMRVIADLNHQYLETQIKGFNLDADETTEGTGNDSQANSGTDAKQLLNQIGWGSEEILAQPFSRNQGEASDWARAAFRQRASEFLLGDLWCVGNANLKVGKDIHLSGASSRLNGTYKIIQAQHAFDLANGYKTRIKVKRASWQN